MAFTSASGDTTVLKPIPPTSQNILATPVSSRQAIRREMACREKLGGIEFAELSHFADLMIPAWQKAVEAARDNAMYREIYCGKAISVIAITESIYHGYAIAYASGLGHRVSASHLRWMAVHQDTVGGIPNIHPHQAIEMNPLDAIENVELNFIGNSVEGLFSPELNATYSEPALFVYPENWLTPKYLAQFIDRVVKDDRVKHAIVITKNPVILTDCVREAVTVITAPSKNE